MTHSHRTTRRALGIAGTSAALAATAALLAQGSASADVFLKLPSQFQATTLPDGTKITVERTNEQAIIAPSLGGTPLHRAAQVSGKYVVTSSKKAKLRIQAGYIVGCQVSITSGTASGSPSISDNLSTGAVTGAATGNASLTLAPGQAVQYYVNQTEKADDFGADSFSNNVDSETTKLTNSYVGTQLQLTGCAGYAQARSFAQIRVRTSNVDKQVFVYGKPFSIG
jgi:hypothetical protein